MPSMPTTRNMNDEESQPLTQGHRSSRSSFDRPLHSASTASTTSLILEHLNEAESSRAEKRYRDNDSNADSPLQRNYDIEEGQDNNDKPADRKWIRIIWILAIVCVIGWLLALGMFITKGSYKHASTKPHDPAATASRGSGKKVTLEQVQRGEWYPISHSLRWIEGPKGEDGLLLETSGAGHFVFASDVRKKSENEASGADIVLIKDRGFTYGTSFVFPTEAWPSKDFKKVLLLSERQHNWRHSFTGKYWIFDVETQTAEPLDPANPDGRIQLASWAPTSDAIVFTRDNNMFLRRLNSQVVQQITHDGGPELFYGVPDWVFEEEVFASNSATWWSEDGKYIAFLRTDESAVPTFPVQYFLSRPSGKSPKPGEENYPEVRNIKYPKAGAPNPVVNLQFYDVSKGEVFTVKIEGDFEDHDRLITEVVWAGRSNNVIVKETNRESDVLKVILMDVERRTGKTVREDNIMAIDGGWFEVSHDTTYVPSDPSKGRNHEGYIDTVIHEGYDHLAYFTPLDNPNPILLTSGKWEVVKAPSAVDLQRNIVYFVATKDGSTQRHVYHVGLDGTGLQAMTDTSNDGYYGISFSKGAGYALLSYQGPNVPWQKIISTPSNDAHFDFLVEDNQGLQKLAREHELPLMVYQTINVDGVELNVLERRPPHFDENKKYPVLFYQYSGPVSQTVSKQFGIDFQSYIASSLGYIVVTVDGRGTGYLGRSVRCAIRGNIGHYEAHDQIAAAQMFAKKKYVDSERMAIWGWSYGGFTTLKTLEVDGGRTFKYGMAVAPVTDWRFYDSVYTERYMHTPQHNPGGYENATISDVQSLSQNVRFLIMHGVADDNVHMQNSLTLLDKLDLAGIENYDVHVFPDSDHSIYFHNANKIVYDKLSNWLINAFNGEWLKTEHAVPKVEVDGKLRRR